MWQFFKKFRILFIVVFIISAISIYLIQKALTPPKHLPIYQPAMVNPALVDSSISYIKKYHTIADFKLINQNGDTITQANYKNKIYVANFFYTTCPSICPIMTANMADLQNMLKDDKEVFFLSHSVTPEIDSVAQLKKYALEKGVDDSRWNLVTGSKKQIYELARKSYMAVKTVGDGGPYDMIHTENFILVDKKRRIRGYYDGTNKDDVMQLLKDIKFLEKES
ncbi:SCO family protein [Zhouia sp. PK063]|uniref:SCO family protein n=1 Tax=Zhouia sp. PK063 TaxID=3373602 RepID=UPI0037B3A598